MQDVAENRKSYIETLKTQLTSSKVCLEKVRGNYEECKETLEVKCREMKNLVRKQESQEHRIGDIKVRDTLLLFLLRCVFRKSAVMFSQQVCKVSFDLPSLTKTQSSGLLSLHKMAFSGCGSEQAGGSREAVCDS